MAMVAIYCLCGQPYDATRFMIQCDVCKDWFHGSCVEVSENDSIDLEKYHCPRCVGTHGPSILRIRTNNHRHNFSEVDAASKPVQTGTPVFVNELKSRHFPSAESVVLRLQGSQLTVPYLTQHGFEVPIIVEKPDGLDMILPPRTFDVNDVEYYIGAEREIDVIDVERQTDIRMKLGEFVEYYNTSPEDRHKTYNVISLEFSNTALSPLVEAPYIARKLDWVNYVFPKDLPDAEFRKPEVQKYCLMGAQDSYTDFHVDFGGTSVWYHILKGQKIFYIIKPTHANLILYQRWMNSSTQSETFFGDQVDMCCKCVLNEGETMLIPTGWIHAVLTPVDSIVFGGNFLHSLNIGMQLQIYDIEEKIHTPEKFRFPDFETTNWYAAQSIADDLREMNNKGIKCPISLLNGVKALITTLKVWSQEKESNRAHLEEIPHTIESHKLVKELSKEVRHAERYLNSLNPPKPERESKRKKKKPVNKDFVDFSQPQSLEEPVVEPLIISLKPNKQQASHPPIKLTLPKPATYPYSTNSFGIKTLEPSDMDSAVLSENKMLRRPVDLHVKMKEDEDLKVPKIECPVSSDGKPVMRFRLPTRETTRPISDSIYDFHDESDEDVLMIDETPKKKKPVLEPFSTFKVPSLYLNGKTECNSEIEVAGEVDVVSDSPPKNGIEELLKASGYAERSEPPRFDDLDQSSAGSLSTMTQMSQKRNIPEWKIGNKVYKSAAYGYYAPKVDGTLSGRASPSTREAIAGMLSISRAFMPDSTSSKEEVSSTRIRRRRAINFSDDYGENIDKVHQDDDYIYPALDGSDDEDLIFKPRGKRKMDEAWNPKARIGQLVPKTDRPTREGTKKQAVEKGLEAAAAKRAGMPSPKRPYNRKKPKVTVVPQPSPSLPSSSTSGPLKKPIEVKSRKPKKGMATAKQRLGKILKIHKMKF